MVSTDVAAARPLRDAEKVLPSVKKCGTIFARLTSTFDAGESGRLLVGRETDNGQ
jgi:hypothetical protein